MALFFGALSVSPTSTEALAETPPVAGEDDDFSRSPYTEYGEFNESSDEAEATFFYQYGKFFGVSLGGGYQGVTGNRGLLWQGGFPAVSLKVHYWFDLNFALQMEFYTASHFYTDGSTGISVNMSRIGLDLKYYIDVRNLGAALTFANPFIAVGLGAYSKSEIASVGSTTPSNLAAFGFAAGIGLEFVIVPKKTYFTI